MKNTLLLLALIAGSFLAAAVGRQAAPQVPHGKYADCAVLTRFLNNNNEKTVELTLPDCLTKDEVGNILGLVMTKGQVEHTLKQADSITLILMSKKQ
jgi:hypothetical protein